jgi:hypothetical protein
MSERSQGNVGGFGGVGGGVEAWRRGGVAGVEAWQENTGSLGRWCGMKQEIAGGWGTLARGRTGLGTNLVGVGVSRCLCM